MILILSFRVLSAETDIVLFLTKCPPAQSTFTRMKSELAASAVAVES